MPTLTGFSDFRLIHEGHQNLVYAAKRENDSKSVIVKMLRSQSPNTSQIALMCHEYEVAKNLHLPGVLETYDLIVEGNRYALVQEDMHGFSLSTYIKEHPIHDLDVFFNIALQMTAIVGDIHRNHIIHKDIKPANFIIDSKDLKEKITGFNFAAKLLHEVQDVVPPEKLEGTLSYMAPEQTGRMNMNIDYRSDFYALGVTFYELLTGSLPFTSLDPLELIHCHLAAPPPDASLVNPLVPRSLSLLIQKLMEKDPDQRYQSAIGIFADLEWIAKGSHDPFPLGQSDVYDRLNLSQKLYGREGEARELLKAYESVSKGAVKGVMVYGYSGIGKTMLINEVHKPMIEHKGHFISGKFDQLQRNTPYTAITQALNELAKHIMAEPEDRFQNFKETILEAMGDTGQIIIELAPEFELVLGKQPKLVALPSKDAQNRMMFYFKKFLQAVATENHPLVIFIDDLQWIDSGSLKILEYILTDDSLKSILLIGAYRDNEVDALHPLQFFLNEMASQKRNIVNLPLIPLTIDNFTSFFKDSFARKAEEVTPLATLIHKRTEGNPFFCKQVVKSLYQENLLFFDYNLRRWDWNLEAIVNLKITDNVVDLMIDRLNELPEGAQELLKYAACLGNRFTIETLMVVSGRSAENIAKELWPAMQMELILTLNLGYKRVQAISHENISVLLSKEITYQFVHDRVQQAVYESISKANREETHLNIANSMLERDPEGCRKERLFEVTDHFNQAYQLLDKTKRKTVASLNNEAALRALAANAYKPMVNYCKSGLQLTDESWWEDHYEVIFNLNRGYVQGLYLIGEIEEAGKHTEKLLKLAKTALDKVSIYRIQTVHFVSIGELSTALDIAIKALGILGVKMLKNPSNFSLACKIAELKWEMRKFNPTNLDNELGEVTDVNIIAAFEIMTETVYLMYWAPGNMYRYLGFEVMLLMLRYGTSPSAGLWVTIYIMSSLHVFHHVDDAFKMWDLAERFIDKKNHKYSSATAYTYRAFWLNHLRYPFQNAHEYFQRAIKDGYESGNLVAVAVNMSLESTLLIAEGRSLQQLLDYVIKILEYSKKIHLMNYVAHSQLRIEIVKRLIEGSDSEESLLKAYDIIMKGKNIAHQTVLSAAMSSYYFYMEQYETAYSYHLTWYPREPLTRYFGTNNTFKAIDAITISKLIPKVSFFESIRLKRKFSRILRDIHTGAKNCPYNYYHQYLVLKAIKQKLKGNFKEALTLFNEAIENAKKGDHYSWIAISNEQAGEMLFEQKLFRYGIHCIREAHYYYNLYGMMAKVNAIEKRYPECFNEEAGSVKHGVAGNIGSDHATSASLDFLSVIKASQTISGEIVLEKLFEKMLHIVIENAGALKAVFLECQNNEWIVIASMEQTSFQMHKTVLNSFKDVPHAIIVFALRSQSPIVINDTRKETQFKDDPYIQKYQPKSVLCMPIVHQEKIVGLIYLENSLSVGSFTKDRVTVLQTLAAQIAISLQNSHQLVHLQQLNLKTERFVPKPFLKMLNRESVEDVALGDSVKKNISVMFNDIRSFTTLIESRTPEAAFSFINRYWKFMAPIIRNHGGYIDQYQGDAILAIFPGSPVDAVQASIAMMHELAAFNRAQIENNDVPIGMGIGVSTGLAMLGVIGEEERHVSGIISDVANTASRIEGLNKIYGSGILISGDTAKELPAHKEIIVRKIDQVQLKGKMSSTEIYEVIEWVSKLKNITIDEYLELFSKAFEIYCSGKFQEAIISFKHCQEYYPEDKGVEVLIKRCEDFVKNGSPKEWNGIFVMVSK